MAISKKKLDANRRNAKKSTGPKTPEGKKAVRLNALKHGLYAKDAVVSSANYKEDQEQYNIQLTMAMNELQPVGFLEESLVYKMVNALWRSRRALRAETSHINHNLDNIDQPPGPDILWQQIKYMRIPKSLDLFTASELAELIESLNQARAFAERYGYLSYDVSAPLCEIYPTREPAIDQLMRMSDEQLDNCIPNEGEIAKNVVNNAEKSERRDKMLALIDYEIEKFSAVTPAADPEPPDPDAEDDADREHKNMLGIRSIPDIPTNYNILHYEMRLDKQYGRALRHLLILQNRRKKHEAEKKNKNV